MHTLVRPLRGLGPLRLPMAAASVLGAVALVLVLSPRWLLLAAGIALCVVMFVTLRRMNSHRPAASPLVATGREGAGSASPARA